MHDEPVAFLMFGQKIKKRVHADAEYINALQQLSRLRIVIVFIAYAGSVAMHCGVVLGLHSLHEKRIS